MSECFRFLTRLMYRLRDNLHLLLFNMLICIVYLYYTPWAYSTTCNLRCSSKKNIVYNFLKIFITYYYYWYYYFIVILISGSNIVKYAHFFNILAILYVYIYTIPLSIFNNNWLSSSLFHQCMELSNFSVAIAV